MAKERTETNKSRKYNLDNTGRAVRKRISTDKLVQIGKRRLQNSEYKFEEEKFEGIELFERFILRSDDIDQ
jgi:hypothetical protein